MEEDECLIPFQINRPSAVYMLVIDVNECTFTTDSSVVYINDNNHKNHK